MKYLLILLVLVSCGKKSSSGKDAAPEIECSRDNSLVQGMWRDTANNDVYDLTKCAPRQNCAYCVLTCGDSVNDFLVYYNDGLISIQYYFYGSTQVGTYQICDDELTIKWADKSADTVFDKVVK